MGYRGKVAAQEEARRRRRDGETLADIASALGVATSSVSLWVRDIPAPVRPRRTPAERRPHPQHLAKLAEIEECDRKAVARISRLSDTAFLAAGVALYAGEGAKSDGEVKFANTDPEMVRFFCAWLRRFFAIDETRLRVVVYLHEGLDLDDAERYWSSVTGIPRSQFRAPYRPTADPTIRHAKHQHGCVYVRYACSRTHRQVMGLVRALLASPAIPG